MRPQKLEVSVNLTERSPLPRQEVERTVRHVLTAEGATSASVSVTFHSSQRMRALNRRTFDRDRSTDVIAFPMNHDGRLVGDIYINPASARRSARENGVTETNEVARLVVHGALHLMGYDHPEGAGRVRSRMWRLQEQYLAQLSGSAR